jgi:hypothetical protein
MFNNDEDGNDQSFGDGQPLILENETPDETLEHFFTHFMENSDKRIPHAGSSPSSGFVSHAGDQFSSPVVTAAQQLMHFITDPNSLVDPVLADPTAWEAVAARTARVDQLRSARVDQGQDLLAALPQTPFSLPAFWDTDFFNSGMPGQSTLTVAPLPQLGVPALSGAAQARRLNHARARGTPGEIRTNKRKVREDIARVFRLNGPLYNEIIAMNNTDFDAGLEEAFQTFRRDHSLLGPTESLTEEQKKEFKKIGSEGSALLSERKQKMTDEVAFNGGAGTVTNVPAVPVNIPDPSKPPGSTKQNPLYQQLITCTLPDFHQKVKPWLKSHVMTRREEDIFKIRRREHTNNLARQRITARRKLQSNAVREEEEKEDQAE